MAARWAGLAAGAAAVVAGAAAGYLGERAALKPRLATPPPPGPALGSIAGELTRHRGPRGVSVAAETYGPPDAVQVVFAHAWTATGRVWHEQVVGLADRLRLLTYDQPGHGRTSPPREGGYDLDLLGDTLDVVIREVATDRPLVLVGHSLGGMTVLNWIRRHSADHGERILGTILCATTSTARPEEAGLGVGIQTGARLERVITRLLRIGRPYTLSAAGRLYRSSSDLSFVLTSLLGLGPGADPRYVDFTEQLLLDADLGMVADLLTPVLQLDEDEGLACISWPTYVLVGAADKLTPTHLARRMADRCAHARLVELPGIGHMVPLEAHATVNALIEGLAAGRVGHELDGVAAGTAATADPAAGAAGATGGR